VYSAYHLSLVKLNAERLILNVGQESVRMARKHRRKIAVDAA
jgi:hypothetical protein